MLFDVVVQIIGPSFLFGCFSLDSLDDVHTLGFDDELSEASACELQLVIFLDGISSFDPKFVPFNAVFYQLLLLLFLLSFGPILRK